MSRYVHDELLSGSRAEEYSLDADTKGSMPRPSSGDLEGVDGADADAGRGCCTVLRL